MSTNFGVSRAPARDASVASAIQGSGFLQEAHCGVPLLELGTRFLVPQAGQGVIFDSVAMV
jgi:hypothetical protein